MYISTPLKITASLPHTYVATIRQMAKMRDKSFDEVLRCLVTYGFIRLEEWEMAALESNGWPMEEFIALKEALDQGASNHTDAGQSEAIEADTAATASASAADTVTGERGGHC